jgi:RNA polymerase sigma factor (sigma-70 family)
VVTVAEQDNKMKELAQRCKNGDQHAYTEVYHLYARKVYNTIYRFIGHTGEAEDIMQDCFVDAFTKIDSFIGKGSLESWIKSIAINKSLSHLRSRKLTFAELDINIHHIAEFDDDQMDYMKYSCEQIHKAILQLSDGYRTIVNLYVFENIPHEEIAQLLGISHSTVRSQYHRAKKRIEMYLNGFD